ncbi:MAG: DUF4142 domain-containing protein [Ginsengibacter sp.]
MKLSKAYFIPLFFTIIFFSCNGGQLREVYTDSAKSGKTNTEMSNNTDTELATVSKKTIQEDIRIFFQQSTQHVNLQIFISKEAIKESSNQAIRNLGKTIVDNETALFNQLKSIAIEKNIALSMEANQSIQDVLSTIISKNGKFSEQAYLNWVIETSINRIKQYEKTNQQFSDRDIQQFITTSISILKQHQNAAEALK